MQQYKNIIQEILENGVDSDDRTGVGTRSIWGCTMRFDLTLGFPITTVRFAPIRAVFEETMFFLRGQTDTKILEDKGINIWKGNTTREFLDGRGLYYLPEGDMGKGYGWQTRFFNGTEDDPGVDQLKNLVEGLRNDPNSRRHLISMWNPSQLHEASLPPCHLIHQYKIVNGRLNSLFYMRSSDFVLASCGFNVPSYALINHMLAKLLGLEVGELVYMAGDVHIYNNHLERAKELLNREPLPLPKLNIKKDIKTLDDMLSLEFEDIELVGYQHHGKFNFPMN